MRRHLMLTGALLGLLLAGCKSHHEEGVKSNYRSQWTAVAANTQATADAAKAVFTDEGLKGVTSSSTNVDGMAEGKKADGTPVKAAIKKKDAGSELSVTVGTMGDPALGAELARKIKMRAER